MEPEKYIIQAEKLADQWWTHDKGVRQMNKEIVIEHLLNKLPREMRTWIVMQQPTADLMQTFLLVKENLTTKENEEPTTTRDGAKQLNLSHEEIPIMHLSLR